MCTKLFYIHRLKAGGLQTATDDNQFLIEKSAYASKGHKICYANGL